MKKVQWYIIAVVLVIISMILFGCKIPTTVEEAVEEVAEEAVEEVADAVEEEVMEDVTIKIMHNWGPESLKANAIRTIFNGFMEAYPYITIEEEVLSDIDINTKLEVAFQANLEPDIVFQGLYGTNSGWMADGVTIDATDLIGEWGFDGVFLESALKNWTDSEGRLLGFPLEGYAVYNTSYNKAILDEAGVTEIPTTQEELLAAAIKIREAGFEPFATGGSDWAGSNNLQCFITAMIGEELVLPLYFEGGWADSPEAIAAFELFVAQRDAGLFVSNVEGLDYPSANELFYSGQAAILPTASWQFAEIPDEIKANIVLGGIPLAPMSPYDKPVINMGFDGKSLRITRNGAEKIDAIEKFTKYFYQGENIAMFVEQSAMVSPLKDTPVDESLLDPLLLESGEIGNSNNFKIIRFFDDIFPTQADIWNIYAKAYIPGVTAAEIIADLDALLSE